MCLTTVLYDLLALPYREFDLMQQDCLRKACSLDFQALFKQNTESEPYNEMNVGDVLVTSAIKEYDEKVHDYHTHAMSGA